MYKKQILALEQHLRDLTAKQAQYEAEKEDAKIAKLAYQHAYESMFDGLKIVSTPETALPLTIPMAIKPNIYYIIDGHLYVGLADTIVTEDNFGDVLTDMEAPAV